METNKCQLSIVIPVFNGSNEINICLDSIYSQGMSPEQFEVICVDDCSTDSTVEVIEDYANRMQPGNLKIIRHNVNKRQGGGGEIQVLKKQLVHISYFLIMMITLKLVVCCN